MRYQIQICHLELGTVHESDDIDELLQKCKDTGGSTFQIVDRTDANKVVAGPFRTEPKPVKPKKQKPLRGGLDP